MKVRTTITKQLRNYIGVMRDEKGKELHAFADRRHGNVLAAVRHQFALVDEYTSHFIDDRANPMLVDSAITPKAKLNHEQTA